jgi:Protein of unknwon function (DUF3310)
VFLYPEKEMEAKPEMVNHPDHYGGDTPYEVIKVLRVWLTAEEFEGWLKGSIIKYFARYKKKGGLQDIDKAIWYSNYLKEFLNGYDKN